MVGDPPLALHSVVQTPEKTYLVVQTLELPMPVEQEGRTITHRMTIWTACEKGTVTGDTPLAAGHYSSRSTAEAGHRKVIAELATGKGRT